MAGGNNQKDEIRKRKRGKRTSASRPQEEKDAVKPAPIKPSRRRLFTADANRWP